jgi:hypothetical protein
MERNFIRRILLTEKAKPEKKCVAKLKHWQKEGQNCDRPIFWLLQWLMSYCDNINLACTHIVLCRSYRIFIQNLMLIKILKLVISVPACICVQILTPSKTYVDISLLLYVFDFINSIESRRSIIMLYATHLISIIQKDDTNLFEIHDQIVEAILDKEPYKWVPEFLVLSRYGGDKAKPVQSLKLLH